MFVQPGLPAEAVQLMFEEAEAGRKDKVERLVRERARFVEQDEQGKFKSTFAAKKVSGRLGVEDEKASEMVEKEAKRLAMLKERQQKELEQVQTYEQTRLRIMLENEAALKAQEQKEAEEKERRKLREAEWQKMQREKEVKKAQEEEAQ
eukprot:scaffold39_cov42-Prasinocladus_malaysianus.AAC.1